MDCEKKKVSWFLIFNTFHALQTWWNYWFTSVPKSLIWPMTHICLLVLKNQFYFYYYWRNFTRYFLVIRTFSRVFLFSKQKRNFIKLKSMFLSNILTKTKEILIESLKTWIENVFALKKILQTWPNSEWLFQSWVWDKILNRFSFTHKSHNIEHQIDINPYQAVSLPTIRKYICDVPFSKQNITLNLLFFGWK
jgi:hypothetical protein